MPVQQQWQRYIFLDRQYRDQIIKLINQPDLTPSEYRQFRFIKIIDIRIIDENFTACWSIDTSQHMKQCRFTRSRWTDDRDKIPFFYRKGYIIQRFNRRFPFSIYFRQMFHSYNIYFLTSISCYYLQ